MNARLTLNVTYSQRSTSSKCPVSMDTHVNYITDPTVGGQHRRKFSTVMSTTAWLLTTDGLVDGLTATNCTLRAAIEQALGTELIECTPVVPGISIWRSLLGQVTGARINAAALGLLDMLLDITTTTLPRIHGDVVIAAQTEDGEPASIAKVGLAALAAVFPTAA